MKRFPSAAEHPSYTFDTFVVTEGSREAFSLAVAVAENPGMTHNPLILHGRTGGGKTHLLHSIAHAIRSRRPGANILRISAETFAAQLVAAIRTKGWPAFERELEAVDVLLLDHLRLAPDRKSTQEEIFRTMEGLLSRGAQVVAVLEVLPTDRLIVERPLFRSAVFAEVG
ncbi:MAG TPA: DnaA/Hda family protein [Thermoanaerobaculia bacterium]|nr:DnaA/Hda family protein [Thermoanaerobaculia bacterium]